MEIDPTKRINPIARIVIIKDGYILLSSATNSNKRFSSELHFLPGGHVEHTESARDTIIREMQEEFEEAEKVAVTDFLGILECVWDNKGEPYHEINIVFKGEIDDFDLNAPPKAKETHIVFNWYKLEELEKLNLLPNTFCKVIPVWIKKENNTMDMFQTEI
mgnify:CR=1 FL=1